MNRHKRKVKHISIKNASRITGLASNSVIMLIKEKEIRSFEKGGSVFVDAYEIIDYKRKADDKNFAKMKKGADARERKNIFTNILFSLKKNIVFTEQDISDLVYAMRMILKTTKHAALIYAVIIFSLGGVFSWALAPKTETIEIFSTKQEGGWQNMERALVRDLSPDSQISEFSTWNSASIFAPIPDSGQDVFRQNEESTGGQINDFNGANNNGAGENAGSGADGEDQGTVQGAENINANDTEDQKEGSSGEPGTINTGEGSADIIEGSVDGSSAENNAQPETPQSLPQETPSEEKINNNAEGTSEQPNLSSQSSSGEPMDNNSAADLSMPQETPTDAYQEESVSGDVSVFNLLDGKLGLFDIRSAQAQVPEVSENFVENNIDSFENASGIILPDIDGHLLDDFARDPGIKEENSAIFTDESIALYSNFDLPEKKGDVRKAKIGFSFASEGIEGEDDEILVEWSLDGSDWRNAYTFKKDKAYSNSENGGYFYASIFDPKDTRSDVINWNDLDNLKVRFVALSNGGTLLPSYLDAVWLEVEQTKPENKETEDNINTNDDGEIKSISSKKDFKRGEEPELKFHYEKKQGFIAAVGEMLGLGIGEEKIKTAGKITNPRGETEDVLPEEIIEFDGDISVKFKKDRVFQAGLYKVVLEVDDPSTSSGQVITFEQDFTWGVLAININKSIYINSKSQIPNPDNQTNPNDQNLNSENNEIAYIQMAALRDDGHTICDAKLSLEITSPSGNVSIFKTADDLEVGLPSKEGGGQVIERSGKCSGDNVTDVPDYFAHYQIGESGIYQMTLTRIDPATNEKISEITDSFEVKDSVPFEVERIGPTRIWPMAPYEMTMKIKANQDFSGEIVETVPEGFVVSEISDSGVIASEAKQSQDNGIAASPSAPRNDKIITWQVVLKAGESYQIKYTFDAPDISPYIYLLGPLEFRIQNIENRENQSEDPKSYILTPVFSELRQWQIASDAPTKWYFKSTTASSGPTGTASSDTDNFTSVPSDKNTPLDMTVAIGALETSVAGLYNNAGAVKKTMMRMFVSPPLAAQTLTASDTITIGIGQLESHNNMNLYYRYFVYVWRSGSGNVKTILVPTSDPSEEGSSKLGCVHNYTGATGNFSILAGDKIVVEVWADIQNTRSTDYTATLYYSGTVDVLDNTATSDAASYISFANNTLTELNSVSGQVCTDESCSGNVGAGVAMVLKQNAGTAYTTTTTASGNYQFTGINMAANDVFTIYVGGTAATDDNGTYNAVTVTKISAAGDLTGINLYTGRVITRYEGSITELTDSDLNNWDSGNDADVHYLAGASSLAVENTEEFHIWTGKTFRPAGTVTTSATGTTAGTGGDIHIDTSSTLNMETNALSVGGDFTNAGTFSKTNPQTTTFTATGTGFSIDSGGSAFNAVVFNGSGGGWTAVTNTFTADGALTITAGNFDTGAVTNAITGATSVVGTLTISSATGTKTFTGDVTVSGIWNETVAEDVSFVGSLANNGTFTASTGVHTFSGGTKTISGTATGTSGVTSIPSVSITGATANADALTVSTLLTVATGITFTNNGTVTATAALSGLGGFTNAANATLNIGGTSGITTLTANANPNTVNYTGAAQTVHNNAYHHLGLSGSLAKTMTSITTIAGDLSVSGSATMTGNAAFTVTGAWNYSSSGSSTLTAAAAISIGKYNQSAGTINDNGNTITVTGTGSSVWTKSAGTFTTSGTTIFTGAAPQIGASNFNNLTIDVGGGNTATLAGAASVAGNLSVSTGIFDLGSYTANRGSAGGTLTVSNGATLKIGGTGTLPSNYSTHSIGATSTVEYAGTTTTVAALNSSQNYGNLTISGTGVTTSTSFSVATALSVGGGGSLIASTGTITMNNSSSISSSGTLTFYNLTIPDSATVTTTGSFAVAGNFTVGPTTAATFTPSAAGVISGAGTLTGYGTVQVTRTAATPDFSSQYTIATKTLTNLTVEYTAALAQTVSTVSYGHLKISTTAGAVATLAATTTVSGNLTISSGGTLAGSSYGLNVAGNWSNSGIFTANSGTVTFNGATQQTITTNAQAFNNVILNNTGTDGTANDDIVISNTLDIDGNFTITNGQLRLDTNNPITTIAGDVLIDATGTFTGGSANITIGTDTQPKGDLVIESGGVYTAGSGILIMDGGADDDQVVFWDKNGTKQNMGTVQIGASPATTNLSSDMVANSLTISTGDKLNTRGYDVDITTFITVTGTLNTTDTLAGNPTLIYLGTNWTRTGIFTQSNSTVTFDGSGTQTIAGTNTWNNLTIANTYGTPDDTNDVDPDSVQTVSGTLTVADGQWSPNAGDDYANVDIGYTDATINGIMKPDSTITVSGNWTRTGTFTHNSGTVTFDGGSAQAITGVTTWNNLIIANTSGGVSSGDNHTVNGVLTLTSDLTMTGSSVLTMGSSATTVGTGDVVGIVYRAITVADFAYSFGSAYTTFSFSNIATIPTQFSVKLFKGSAPSWKSDGILRYYDIIRTNNDGSSPTRVTMNLHYADGAELNGITEANLVVWDSHDLVTPTNEEHGKSNQNTTDNYVEYATFGIGYFPSAFSTKQFSLASNSSGCHWIGAISADWGDYNNWSCARVPLTTDNIYIPDAGTTANDPTLTAGAVARTMTLEASSILNGSSGDLTISYGAGSWNNQGGTFNPGTSTVTFTSATATMAGTTNFNNITIGATAVLTLEAGSTTGIAGTVTITGGGVWDADVNSNTVEYNGTGSQTINAVNYYNLTSSSTGDRTLASSGTIGVAGAFTPGANSYTVTGSTMDFNGGAAQTVNAGFTYNNLQVRPSANSVTANFASGTVTVNGNLTIGNGTNTGVVVSAAANDPNITVLGNVSVSANTTLTNTDDVSKTLNIDGNLTIAGVFTAPSGTGDASFTLGGNFTNNGTFNHGSGQLTLDTTGAAQLTYSADTTFYQLSVLSASAGKNIQFDEVQTTIIANDLTIQGTNCTTGRIFLDSYVNDDPWLIYLGAGATQNIDYIDLEDADATGTAVTPVADNSTQTGSNTGWTVNAGACATGISVSGKILQESASSPYEGTTKWASCDGTTTNISWALDGADQANVSCALADGAFTLSVPYVSANQVLVIWLDTNGGDKGVLYLKNNDTTTPISGLTVFKNKVWIQSESSQSISNSNINSYDKSSNDTDIPITSDGTNATVDSGVELHINTGDTYAPGGNVSVDKVHLLGTYTGASETLTLNGSGSSASCDDTVANLRPLCVSGGTFTATSNTVTYAGSAASTIETLSYYILSIGAASSANITYSAAGNLIVNNAVNLQSAAATYTNTFDLGNNNLTVGSASIAGSGGISVPTRSTFNQTGGTTTVKSASGSATIGGAGTATFGNLTVGTASDNLTYNFNLGGGITVSNNFTITDGGTGVHTFDVTGSNHSITVGGNWTNNDTFTSQAGTVNINSANGWNYKKAITLSNGVAGELTNYQVKVIVDQGSGTDGTPADTVYCGTNCKTDFGDIRFTSASGVPIDYWMEGSTSPATFWVEVPSIPASGTATIYMLYEGSGSSKTTTMNGGNTFVFFDDFLGTAIDTSKWNIADGTTYSLSSSILSMTIASFNSVLQNFNMTNYFLETKTKEPLSGNTGLANWRGVSGASETRIQWYAPSPYFGAVWFVGGTIHTGRSTTYTGAGYDIAGIKVLGTNSVKFYKNYVEVYSSTAGFTTGNAYINIFQSSGGVLYTDWIRVRQYASTEPTKSYGSETSTGGTIIPGGSPFYNITFNGLASTFATNAAVVSNNFTLTAGSVTAPSSTLNVAGAFSLSSGTTYTKGGTLTFDGATQVLTDSTAAPGQDLGAVTIGPSTATSLSTADKMHVTSLTSGTGGNDTFDISGDTLTISGTGTPFAQNGTFTVTGSTVVYDGISATNITSTTYNNLNLGGSGTTVTYTAAGDITSSGVLTIVSSSGTNTFDASNRTITLSGTGTPFVTNGEALTEATSTFVYSGATTATNITAETYYNLNLGDSATTTTYTAVGDITVSSILTIVSSSGTNTFDASNRTITLSGTGTPFVNNETFTPSTSIVSYTGNGATNIASITYYTLNIGASNSANITYTALGNITANNNVNLQSAAATYTNTLDLYNYNLTVGSASVTNSGGIAVPIRSTFNQDGGTTTVKTSDTGLAVIGGAGATTFWNLTVGTASDNLTYTFNLGGALTVSNDLNITAGGTGTHTLDVTATNYGLTVGGSWTNSSTFTKQGGTVTFSDGWSYRKKITLDNAGGLALTNYQVKVIVDWNIGTETAGQDTIYCDENCQANFDDIRFTDANGNQIDYWMESSTNPATFWVEVPLIAAPPTDTDIYMYYGNSVVTTTSNGANTFIQWHGATTDEFVDPLVINPSISFIFEADARSTDSSGLGDSFGVGVANNSIWYSDSSLLLDDFNNGNITRFIVYDNGSSVGSETESPSWTLNQWYRVKIVNMVTSANGYLDENQIGITISGSMPTELLGLTMYEGGVHTGEQRWSFIRQYVVTEPTKQSFTDSTRTIAPGGSSFNTLIFNDGGTPLGAWTFGANAATIASDFTLTAGAVTAPSTNLNVAGNFSNSGTFTHNSGTVTFDGTTGTKTIASGGSSFANIIFNDGGNTATFQPTDNLTVIANFTLTDGILDFDTSDPTVQLGDDVGTGNVTINGGSITKSGTASIILNDNPTYYDDNVVGGVDLGNVQIGMSPAVTKLKSDMTATNLTIVTGDTYETHGWEVTLSGYLDCQGTCTLDLTDVAPNNEGDGTIVSVGGNWTMSGSGVFTASSNSIVDFTKASGTQTLNSGGTGVNKFFDNLTHSGAGTLQLLTNAIDVDGNFSQTAGIFDANSLSQNYSGDFSLFLGTTYTKGGTLTFDGATQVLTDSTAAPGQDLGTVTIGPSTATSLSTANKMHVTTLTSGTGGNDTFDISGDTLTISGTGTPFTQNGTFTVTGSTVVYDGTSATNITSTTYNNLNLGGSATTVTYTAAGDITASGVLTIVSSSGTNTFDASSRTITLNGADIATPFVTNGEALTEGTSTFIYSGNNSGGNVNVTAETYNILQINNASETYVLAGATTGAAVTITAGILDLNGTTLVSTGDLTVNGTLQGSTNVTVNGNVTGSGTVTLTGGTFEQIVSAAKNFGSSSGNNDWTFSGLKFNNSSGGSAYIITPNAGTGSVIVSGTLTLGDSGTQNITFDNETSNDRIFDINGSILISTKGVFSASSSASFTLAGNFTDNKSTAGGFTPNSGTVVIDGAGTSTFDGANTPAITFYNLASTTAGKTLQFTAGKTFKINTGGKFTISGTAGSKVNINSTTGSQWLIDHQGTEDVTFANITNSGCAGGTTNVSLNGTSTNGGNNGSCWLFPSLSFTLNATSVSMPLTFPNFTNTAITTLTVSTAAASGYSLTAFENGVLTHTDTSTTIANWAGSNASPTTWAGNCVSDIQCGFGYNTNDADLAQFSGSKYAGFTSTPPGDIVAKSTGPVTGDVTTITYKTSASNIQKAGTYQNTIIYIVTPQF